MPTNKKKEGTLKILDFFKYIIILRHICKLTNILNNNKKYYYMKNILIMSILKKYLILLDILNTLNYKNGIIHMVTNLYHYFNLDYYLFNFHRE